MERVQIMTTDLNASIPVLFRIIFGSLLLTAGCSKQEETIDAPAVQAQVAPRAVIRQT